MKQLTLVAFTALLGLGVLLTGCTKKSSSSSTSSSYSMKATIGSTSMNGSVCIASVVSSTLAISGSTVTGGVGGPPQINIAVASWTGTTGTFTLGLSSTGSFGQYVASTGALASMSQTGSVTITSVTSTTIKGTFNFTCTDGKVISAGSFTAQRT